MNSTVLLAGTCIIFLEGSGELKQKFSNNLTNTF